MFVATTLHAQTAGDTTNAPKATASGQDEYPDIVELCVFGGVQTNGQVLTGLDTKLVDGGVAGLRIAYNPTKWMGLELWADYAQANVEFKTSTGVYPAGFGAAPGSPLPTYSFGARNYYFGLNPVFNLRPRGSKFQPYLTAGVFGVQFTPENAAETLARSPQQQALYASGNLNDNLQVGINYGGGIKWHLSDHIGLRVDARGFWSRNPTYDLPNFPDVISTTPVTTTGVYIPAKAKLNSFQGTVGLVFYFGQGKCPPMPPAPPAPPPLPTPTITGGEGTICQGKPVNLHANIQGPAGHNLTYAWTLNGAPQSGATGADFSFTPNNTGTFNVQVTVTDTAPPPAPMERPKNIPVRCWVQPPTPPPAAPVTATASLTVADTTPTISNVSANPTGLTCAANANGTHTAQLTATAAASACGGNLTYKWTVSEGSVSNDTSANATFDASTLNFAAGAAAAQTKTVTATVTVTDETGKTASQSTTITVDCPQQQIRLDDVVFAKNSSRVNNCGKRLLIDDAARRMASGDYDIVLVGHRAEDEEANVRGGARGRGRRGRRGPEAGRAIDEARALNSAAVLTGGGGTCASVDPSHVRVDWVGTDQTSDPRPGQCATSNIKERRGSQVTDADKYRRVEIYLVPRGSQQMPPAVKNIKPLPEREVKALGCPK
ncbi:MAG: PKD domain-containing protein [Acidobacteriaceae bacterium]|nr:PKD domain-containing protein [Acidobacteriaceae bacterium]